MPKPPKAKKSKHINAWRRSFSREEKYKLNNEYNESKNCSKQVVRFLKGLSKQESTLNSITSYYWKTLLFHAMENDAKKNNNKENNDISVEQSDGNAWESSNLHTKTFEMLAYMGNCVKNRCLAQYFNPKMNLLQDMPLKQSQNISNRLVALCKNENKFLEAIVKVEEKEEIDLNETQKAIAGVVQSDKKNWFESWLFILFCPNLLLYVSDVVCCALYSMRSYAHVCLLIARMLIAAIYTSGYPVFFVLCV